MTTYQFEVDDETWAEWKQTVPRSKSLQQRIIELLKADAEGRVQQPPVGAAADGGPDPVVEYAEPEDPVDEVIEHARQDFSDDRADRRQARVDTLQAALAAVKREPLSKSEIEEQVYNGEVPGQNAETWFRKTVRPYLSEVAEYSNSDKKWYYTG